MNSAFRVHKTELYIHSFVSEIYWLRQKNLCPENTPGLIFEKLQSIRNSNCIVY